MAYTQYLSWRRLFEPWLPALGIVFLLGKRAQGWMQSAFPAQHGTELSLKSENLTLSLRLAMAAWIVDRDLWQPISLSSDR